MFDPRQGRQHSFVEIDHEIFSAVMKYFLRSFSPFPSTGLRRAVRLSVSS